MSGSSSPGTVVTLAGAALATAAGISGALIDIVGFQIGSGVIVGTPSNLASGVSALSYPTQTGVDPSTLIAATASMLSYQVVNSNTMLFTITLDSTVGGAGFNVGNIGLYIANPGGGYQLFSLTALPAVDFKYANNPPLIGNTRNYNVAIQLTGIASAINISILNVSNYVLPTVANNAALPAVLSAASPVYIVKADSNYNGLTSLALRNSGSTGWDYIPQDFGWALAGDQSVYGIDTGTGGTAYHINVVPAPTALTAGRVFRVLIAYNNTNTGNATLNVNSLGNVNIINPDGSSLYASQIVALAISVFIYDGTNFQLMSQAHPTVNKRGDSINGNLVVVGNLSSTSVISATQESGVSTGLLLQTNNQTRWYISKYSDVESGTYGGSSLAISSYDNTGTFIANVVSISRATGVVGFSSIPTAPTATVGDSSTNLATTAFIQKTIQSGSAIYAIDTGTVNNLVVSMTPTFTSYYAGMLIRVKLANTTTSNCSIVLNGLASKYILNPDGTQLSAGQGVAGAILELVFDGTNFQLVSNNTSAVSTYGGNMSGLLTLEANIRADGASGYPRGMHVTTATVERWFINGTNDAEGTYGSNVGTNFGISRYSDAGVLIDNPLTINRATGIVNFSQIPTFPTAGSSDNSTKGANTQFVQNAINSASTYYVQDTGTVNAIVGSTVPALSALAAGNLIKILIANTNTSATVTANINSLGAKTILNPDGSAPQIGQIKAGSIVTVVYDGTRLQIQSIPYAPVNRAGDTVNGALTIAGNLQTNSSLILVNSGSTSRIYTDPSTGSYGANDIVFNTGSAYTIIDSGGNLHLTGIASIAPATALTHAVSWGEFNGGTDTGTANNIHLTMAGITNYSQVAGIPITFQLANNITGAAVVNINGIGNVSLLQGGYGLGGGEGVSPWNYTIVYWAGSFHIIGSGAGAVNVGTPSVGTHATNVNWVNANFASLNGSTGQVFAVANPPDGNHAPNVYWCYSNLAQIGGTTSASFYANSSSSASEGDIGANASGFSPAYLYNAAGGWGLYSAQGGTIISYNRTSNSTNLNGVTINSAGTMHLAQIPNHPTPPTTDNSTDSATTAFVWASIASYIATSSPPTSGGPEGPCFLYGTPIVMADNTIKQIQMVKVGEFVLGANGEINEVLALHRPLLGKRQLVYINDDHITPADHPHTRADMKGFYSCDPEDMVNGWGHYVDVFTANGREQWRNIGISDRHLSTMQVGVELWTIDGPRVVETMDFIDAPMDTQLYNFVLGGSHTYFANGYSVTGWPNDIDFDYDTWTPTGAVYSPDIKEMEMA